MGKVYLRKVTGLCSTCFFANNSKNVRLMNLKTKHTCSKMPCPKGDFHYKKISEKHAKKLLKSGKCKIVQQ